MLSDVDISEQKIFKKYPKLLDVLLIDRTTGRNIIWGTDDYLYVGNSFGSHYPITKELISGIRANVIQPRVVKSKEQQGNRTKGKAEVFTPAWLCNEQNNLVDNAWFGSSEIFNIPGYKCWTPTTRKIKFPDDKRKTWQKYVDERRLEIACGEAPYLVSRYDSTTGEIIKLRDRIGFLDRKLRVISENIEAETEWLKWVERAYQSIYGFEFQGDNLLLARENLLYSYADYMESNLKRQPTEKEILNIAKIISWNLWQMDALTMTIPYRTVNKEYKQLSFFDNEHEVKRASYCRVKDWRSDKIIDFIQLTKGVT